MLYWWITAHWQAQYAMDVYCPTDISLNTVKSMTIADDRLRYFPTWAAAKKKGWPNDLNMADCFQNPAYQLITLEEGSTLEEGTDKFGENCQEGKA